MIMHRFMMFWQHPGAVGIKADLADLFLYGFCWYGSYLPWFIYRGAGE